MRTWVKVVGTVVGCVVLTESNPVDCKLTWPFKSISIGIGAMLVAPFRKMTVDVAPAANAVLGGQNWYTPGRCELSTSIKPPLVNVPDVIDTRIIAVAVVSVLRWK